MAAYPQAQLLVLLLICAFLFPSIRATKFKYCGNADEYAVKVKDVEISPNPVVRGQPATFKILGSTGRDISGGKVTIKVSFYSVHVHTEEHDLCEETSCPVSSGSFVLAHSQTLPSITPPGSYTLRMTVDDKEGKELTCISFNFKITLWSPVSSS